MRLPAQALAVDVLEPGVGADHVEIPVAIEVGHPRGTDRSVNGRPDAVPLPKLSRVLRDPVPDEFLELRPRVAHHHDVLPAIPIDVGCQDVVRTAGAGGEDVPFKGLLARPARIAVPDAAAHQIHPAVAIDIECGEFDI